MKSTILFTLISLAFISGVKSQANSDSIIEARADSMIYHYARYGSFTENDRSISKQYIKNFKALFTKRAAVYNDILTDLYSEELLYIDEYTKGSSEKYPSGITVSISKKEFGEISRIPDTETATLEVKAEKEILGMTIDDEFYEETFDITFIISFNLDLTNFKIIGVRKLKIENRSLTLKVIKAKDGSVLMGVRMNLFYNNKLQQTRVSDSDGVVNFSEIPPKSVVRVLVDEDEDFVKKDEDWVIEDWVAALPGQRQILLSRVKEWSKFSLEVFGTPSITQIKSDNVSNNYKIGSFANDSEFGYGIGVNVSYALFYNKKIAISLTTGVGLDIYNSSIVFNDYDQNYIADLTDTENDSYDLFVLSDKLTDNITLTYLSIPLMVNFRKYFDKKMLDYFFINLGVSYGNLMNNTSEISGEGTFYGFYEEVSGQTVNVDIHNVPDLNFKDNGDVGQKKEMDISTMNLSGIASIGISIPIVKDILNFDIAANINYGFVNISNYDYNKYYFAEGGFNSDKSSLIGSGSNVSTMAYGARIGLTYNIFK